MDKAPQTGKEGTAIVTSGVTEEGIVWQWTLDDGDLGELWLTIEDDDIGRSMEQLFRNLRIPHKVAYQPALNGDAPLGALGPPSLQRVGAFPLATREFDGPSLVLLFLTLFEYGAPPRPLREALENYGLAADLQPSVKK